MNEINISVQTHNIRKTAITEYYNMNKDIVATKDFVGHSDIKITQLYVEKKPSEIIKGFEQLMHTREANQALLSNKNSKRKAKYDETNIKEAMKRPKRQ